VIFTGFSDAERLAGRDLAAELPDSLLLPATLPLSLIAACMARLNLFIGNDNGLLHLAAASGAPTLGLFGPTRADEFAPAGTRAAVVSAPGPAGRAPIVALTVEAVLAAALPLLFVDNPSVPVSI
jgi:ADP-heptose:LPS heptosyltransferase